MKQFTYYILAFSMLGGAGTLWAQSVGQATQPTVSEPAAYTITQKDNNSRLWERTTYEELSSGQIIPKKHSYTELATGLNHLVNGEWSESSENISILADGTAAATNGQHQVYFPADIYNGVIELVTPDGKHLKSQPVALSYDDGTNTSLIAVLTNSVGYLADSNQVIYPNAFVGVEADLRYTYKRGSFEQDIILRKQPPPPESLGIDPNTAKLQVLTEFFSVENPGQNLVGAIRKTGLSDMTLTFGQMKMVQGKAFVMSGDGKIENAEPVQRALVYKSWQRLQGRTFLVEEVPVSILADDLEELPTLANVTKSSSKTVLNKVYSARILPPQHLAQAANRALRVAKVDFKPTPGLVLDYNIINTDQTDYTFYSGQTYSISGFVNLYGTTTIQGGAILKFNGGCLSPGDEIDPVSYPSDPANPAILTSVDDNSVGEPIGSGTPTVGSDIYISIRADTHSMPCLISNIWVFYAGLAIQDQFSDGFVPVGISDSQFINCNEVMDSFSPQIKLNNVLFSSCQIIAGLENFPPRDIQATHITADQCEYFIADGGANGGSIELTNSILSDVTNMTSWVVSAVPTSLQNSLIAGTNYANIVWSANSSQIPSVSGLYTTPGNADYYLAPSSPYRDVGTTAIDSGLLSEIQTMTTYAPQDGSFLDTNTPDLGYHYPAYEDTDLDGLSDSWEWQHFGHLGVDPNADPDGDGLSNLQEYELGTNPTIDESAQSALRENYSYTLADWLNGVSGIKSGTVSADNEGNVLQVSQ